MIPLILDLSGRRVVIFGGGKVGLRKSRYFVDEADLVVISRDFLPDFHEAGLECIEKEISILSDAEISDHIRGAVLVIAATSDTAQNNRIRRICSAEEILFNNARGETGNVILPSVVQGENYQIAVSTGGKSPAVARYLRILLEKECEGLDEMIRLQQELRAALRENPNSDEDRAVILREVLDDHNIWDLLTKDPEKARDLVIRKYCL